MDNKTGMNLYKITKYINLIGVIYSISGIYSGVNPVDISLLFVTSFGVYGGWCTENNYKKNIKNEKDSIKKQEQIDRIYSYIQECKEENKSFNKNDLEKILK